MVNVDVFNDKAKAMTAQSVYEKKGRKTALGSGLGFTVDDRRVDPAKNLSADPGNVWVLLVW